MVDTRDALEIAPAAAKRRVGRLRRQLERRKVMKLASLTGGRDGRLAVVSRDLSRAAFAHGHRADAAGRARRLGGTRNRRSRRSRRNSRPAARRASPSTPDDALAPLPRAYHWVDGSAYVNHVELVRKARGADDAGVVLDRPARLPGRLGRFPAADGRCAVRQRGLGHRPRGRDRGRHRRRADGHECGRRARAHPARHARERLVAAEPDPGRTRQGLRLLPVEARDRVLAGRGDAGRTRRRLETTRACTCRSSCT